MALFCAQKIKPISAWQTPITIITHIMITNTNNEIYRGVHLSLHVKPCNFTVWKSGRKFPWIDEVEGGLPLSDKFMRSGLHEAQLTNGGEHSGRVVESSSEFPLLARFMRLRLEYHCLHDTKIIFRYVVFLDYHFFELCKERRLWLPLLDVSVAIWRTKFNFWL